MAQIRKMHVGWAHLSQLNHIFSVFQFQRRSAVGSSLLCEETWLFCHTSPQTHKEAILIVYSFTILSETTHPTPVAVSFCMSSQRKTQSWV